MARKRRRESKGATAVVPPSPKSAKAKLLIRNHVNRAWGWMSSALRAAFSGLAKTRKPRRLELCETLSLGDKRFVAIVRFEDQRFLVGGAANSISLLAPLPGGAGRLGSQPDARFSALLDGIERRSFTIQ